MHARTTPTLVVLRGLLALGLGAALAAGCREGAPADGNPGTASEQQSGSQSGQSSPGTSRQAQPVTVAAGTAVQARLESAVATDKNHVGDAVVLRTIESVVVNGRTAVPAGSVVHGTVTHVRAAGRVKGAAELTLRFTELELPNGQRFAVTCEPYRQVVKGDGKESAAEIGGGAAVGGVLGGVLGGKDDMLKGAAIGAAVGTGVAVATKGQQVVLPAGQALHVRLAAPVTLSQGTTS
jgi:hypothetical protein